MEENSASSGPGARRRGGGELGDGPGAPAGAGEVPGPVVAAVSPA